MVLVLLLAFPLSKEKHEFRARALYVWFFFFTMLFEGGLIPLYMTVATLGLLDTIWALVLPRGVQVFLVLLMLNFFRQVPQGAAGRGGDRRRRQVAHPVAGVRAGGGRCRRSPPLPCSCRACSTGIRGSTG